MRREGPRWRQLTLEFVWEIPRGNLGSKFKRTELKWTWAILSLVQIPNSIWIARSRPPFRIELKERRAIGDLTGAVQLSPQASDHLLFFYWQERERERERIRPSLKKRAYESTERETLLLLLPFNSCYCCCCCCCPPVLLPTTFKRRACFRFCSLWLSLLMDVSRVVRPMKSTNIKIKK